MFFSSIAGKSYKKFFNREFALSSSGRCERHKKNRITCGSPRQPGYLIRLRPVAFRPRLATGLALSGKQLTVIKNDSSFYRCFSLFGFSSLKIGGFLGDQIQFVLNYSQCAFYVILFQMRENQGNSDLYGGNP
jgi:hypothetical protein